MEENGQSSRDRETFATWNEIASIYEIYFMDLDCYNSGYNRFLELLLGTSVLDLGCGPGNISRFLKQQRADLSISAWDIAPNMVDIARKWVPDGRFLVKDIRDVANNTEVFAGVICGFGLPYIAPKDRDSFFAGIARSLEEGGVVYLSFVSESEEESGYKTGSNGKRVFFHYHDQDELTKDLQQCGFRFLEISEVCFERADKPSEIHTIVIARKGL